MKEDKITGETLYEKRGRRYHPVQFRPYLDSYGVGAHLVVVLRTPGEATLTSYRHNVDPDRAAVLAAVAEVREAMSKAAHKANQLRLDESKTYTKKQREEYRRFAEALRDEPPLMFQGVAPADLVDAAVRVLEEKLGITH